jgi:hypothetical protein
VSVVPVGRKLSKVDRPQEESCLFRRGDYRIKDHNPEKTVLGSSLCKCVGFRDNFSMILKDTYRMTMPIISFQAINIDKKGKHLSNFPAVTVRGLWYDIIQGYQGQ